MEKDFAISLDFAGVEIKKGFTIELDYDQINFLKTRFGIWTDKELRNILQRLIEDLINKQSACSLDKK